MLCQKVGRTKGKVRRAPKGAQDFFRKQYLNELILPLCLYLRFILGEKFGVKVGFG